MNIKYRLLCKRLIEERKRVGVIQYYNVLFIMELVSDKDIWAANYAQTECQFRYCGTAIPFLTVRSTAR